MFKTKNLNSNNSPLNVGNRKEVKQRYKVQAENSFDHIASTYLNAQHNGIEMIIDESDKAKAKRYYTRYWDNEFFLRSFFITLVIGILSFYTTWASMGILLVIGLSFMYSQSTYCRYFLNDHSITRDELKKIVNLIFGQRIDFRLILLFGTILAVLSVVISFNSIAIFLDQSKYSDLVSLFSKFGVFKPENEIYAYFNISSILLLLMIKSIEKWWK